MATRILVDHAGQKGLGDIVCEIGAYRALRRLYPDAAIASRASRTLAWGSPWIDAFDETSPDSAFDRVIRFPSAVETYQGLPGALSAGRTIFGHFLDTAGLAPDDTPPELFVLPREMAELGLEDDGGPGLIVAYSADAVEPYRRWGAERFEALVRRLDESGVSLIELGSGVTAGHLGVGLDMVGQTDLRQTMAVVSLADLFIGNHGGLTHLAGAVGTPILSPWGASHPYRAYAYDDVSVALETAPACRHCHWTQRAIAECVAADPLVGRTPCTQDISVSAMAAAYEAIAARISREREALRERKSAIRARSRDPLTLSRFDREGGFNADAFIQFYLGGEPGWGPAHRVDHFDRLKAIAVFPDWEGPQWQEALDEYARSFSPASPWVLVIAAHPLKGTEALERIEAWAKERLAGPLPKVLVLSGVFGPEARAALAKRAAMVVESPPREFPNGPLSH